MRYILLLICLSLGMLLQSCSNTTLRSIAGGSNKSEDKASMSSDSDNSDLSGSENDRKEYAADEYDEDVTAIPPQIVTGAYLVCSSVDPGDSETMAEMTEGFPQASHSIISCGIQTQSRTKHPAKTQFGSVSITCEGASESSELNTVAAPDTSKWHIFGEYPQSDGCVIQSISASITIEGRGISLETKITDDSTEMPPPAYHLMFVTSKAYPTGEPYPDGFNDLKSADQLCADHAKLEDITSFSQNWKAVLSSTAEKARDRIEIFEDVYSVNMGLLYKSGKFWSKMMNPIHDEANLSYGVDNDGMTGEDQEFFYVWTGIKDSGDRDPDNCDDWQTNEGNFASKHGDLNIFDGKEWIADDKSQCDQSLRLYCISQFEGVKIKSPGVAKAGKSKGVKGDEK